MLGATGPHSNPKVIPENSCDRGIAYIQTALDVSIKVRTKDMDVVCRRMLLLSRP